MDTQGSVPDTLNINETSGGREQQDKFSKKFEAYQDEIEGSYANGKIIDQVQNSLVIIALN